MTPARLKAAIPECTLTEATVGPQISRYSRLAEHVTRIKRSTGEVRVEFDERVPEALLSRTLSVERECCSFLNLAYDPGFRSLTITVRNTAHDPRLDSLAMLLTPPAAR
jgi:hypothetical protein